MDEKKLFDKIDFIRKSNADTKIKKEILNCITEIECEEIQVRVKSEISALNKIIEENKAPEDITDLLGVMVITNEKDDVYEVVKKIILNNPIAKVQNYISNPKNGYKSIHINFEKNIGNQNIPVEIQVKTREMYEAQKKVHDSIYKNYIIPKKYRNILSRIAFEGIEIIESMKKKVYFYKDYKLNEEIK